MDSARELRTIGEHVAAVLTVVRSAHRAPPPGAPPTDRARHTPRIAQAGAPALLPLDVVALTGPGLVLADDVVAVAAVPGFDHSAVDGYAVRLADLPDDGSPDAHVTLTVVGAVRAGDAPGAGLGPTQAVRIMTGAPLPAGVDAVVPVELTSTRRFAPGHAPDEATVSLARPRKDNIRRRGEDIRAGLTLGRHGSPVTPALIAAAAAAGVTHLCVVAAGTEPVTELAPRPRVAVISTGSELRPAGQTLGAGEIVDSNSLMVSAIVRGAGGEPVRRGGVADDAASLRAALDAVCDEVDLVVSTGGVSAGAFDVVRQVLTAEHADGAVTDADLTAVAQRPGRPQGIARWRGVPWIALPGTPSAAFVSTYLYVSPAVAALRAGGASALRADVPPAPTHVSPAPTRRRLGPSPLWARRTGDVPLTRVIPVRAVDDVVVPTADTPGCGHALTALLAADGLALVTPGAGAGSLVEVVRL